MIKRNRTWKNRSMPDYSQAFRCTTDSLHVSLRPVTFCHGVLRSTRFIAAHYVSHFRRDCRGRFLNCQKICHGVHGYPGVLRLPIPFPCVASRLSRFAHGCLKRGRRDRREHSVNAVLRCHDTQNMLEKSPPRKTTKSYILYEWMVGLVTFFPGQAQAAGLKAVNQ